MRHYHPYLILILFSLGGKAQVIDLKYIDNFEKTTQGKITINKNLGVPSFIKFPANKPLDLNGSGLKEKTHFFLNSNKEIYPISNLNESLDAGFVKTDNYGLKHYILKQYYKGVPVYDAELRFHFNKNEQLTAINGNTIPSININSVPKLSKSDANTIALNMLTEQNINYSGAPLKVIQNDLYIFPSVYPGYVLYCAVSILKTHSRSDKHFVENMI